MNRTTLIVIAVLTVFVVAGAAGFIATLSGGQDSPTWINSYDEQGRVINLPCGEKFVDFEHSPHVGISYSTRAMLADESPTTHIIRNTRSLFDTRIVECR